MRKLMTIFLAMICISVGFTVEIMAQSIIISVDGINQEADTLDFGARTVNNPKLDSFYVVNNTNDTLYIPIDPFFLNRVNSGPNDNTFAEFALDTIQQRNRPFVIPPQSTFPVKVTFNVDSANKGTGFEADQFLKRARIFIKLSRNSGNDTNKVAYRDTIHVIGDRTERFMKPKDSVIVFDTMYLGSTKTDTLIVYNGNSNQDLQINITQNISSNVIVNPNDIGSFVLATSQFKKIPITYTVTKLTDSLIKNALTITSSPGGKASIETSQISLKSSVIFQKFEINKVLTSNLIQIGDVTYSSDTMLTFTDIIDVGESRLLEIALKNTGNIPISIDSITAEGPLKNNFIVDKNPSINTVQPYASTKVSVLFSPKLNGPIKTNIVIHTNLKNIFPKLENNDDKQSITVTGNGRSGDLFIDNGVSTCKDDTVLFSELCNTTCEKTFSLSNFSESTITINDITFTGDPSVFYFAPPLGSIIDLGPGETKKFKVDYIPGKRQGNFKGSLSFITEGEIETRTVNFVSVSPEATIARDTINAAPGDVLKIPLIVKTSFASIDQAGYFNFGFSVPEKSIRGFRIDSIELNLSDIYSKKFNISNEFTVNKQTFKVVNTDPSLEFKSDTIAFIHGKYYLNEFLETEIFIDNFFLGVDIDSFPCEIFKVVNLPKIIIKPKENSRCADQETLDSLFADIKRNRVAFMVTQPYLGESVVEIQHFIPETSHTEISIYSVTGEKVETIFSGIAPTELTKIRHPLTNLPKGVYYCELRTGAFSKTIPIVIAQ